MSKLQRVWETIKAAFEAEGGFTDGGTVDRAIGWDQISEQVWSAVRDIYLDCYPWITGFYQDQGQTFVVISHEGKLYKHMVTITDNTVTVGPGEPVIVEFMPVSTPAMDRSTITIHRQADGRIRGVGIVATSVLNRVGEIDSRDLFDSFVEHWKESGNNPILEFYHLGEKSRLGEIDYLARDGNVYINSWLFDDSPIGRAAADALETDSDYWGFSIGYLPTCDPTIIQVTDGVAIPVYTRGIQRETSIVAEKRAANLFTMPISGVNRMNPEIKKDLTKLMGGDEKLTEEAEQMIDTRNRAIEENGLITRADQPESAIADGDQTAAFHVNVEPPTVELDDAALTAIARTVENGEQFAALTANVASLAETVTALVATVAEMTTANTAANTETQRRLQALEADEETKRQIYREDLPAKAGLRVTCRAPGRGPNAPAGQPTLPTDQPETMADVAAKTLEKIPARY